MTDPRLLDFLRASYSKRVLSHSVDPARFFLADDPDFVQAARDELERISRIGSPAMLAKRDFALYQAYIALTDALEGVD